MKFKGFQAKRVHLTPIPGPFFSELLPQIDDLGELKLSLYAFWRLDQLPGEFRWLKESDFLEDRLFMQGLAPDPEQARLLLQEALRRSVERGLLLEATLGEGEMQEKLYFMNSAKGRTAVEAIQNGRWQPGERNAAPAVLRPATPNIFRLYENHVGPVTPLLAESLGEAEDLYPAEWIEEAFQIAVEHNARNWRYIEAILKRWHKEGRNAKENRRDSKKTGREYIEGELSDFIKR
jgi:DnaD/phage-associated family protein